MNLFERINFTSHSGLPLTWKVECDALTLEDWDTIAFIISQQVKFSRVVGIPSGGTKLAQALKKYSYISPLCEKFPRLIVDDVCTTGKSLIDCRSEFPLTDPIIGFVVFTRNYESLPTWCRSLWVSGI